jgi:hypothetical protein
VPTTSNSTMATFAQDTAVIGNMGDHWCFNQKTAISCKQNRYLDKEMGNKSQRIKIVHIDFTNNKIKQQPIFIIGTKVPYANTAKYLGMTLDAKLRWKEHTKKKRDELNIKFRKMYGCLHVILSCQSTINSHYTSKLYVQFGVVVSSSGGATVILIFKWFNATKRKYKSILLTHHGTFEIVTFIVISESRRLQMSSLSSPSLMKIDFKTTSTSKRPDFSTWTISPDDWSGWNRLNYLYFRTLSDSIDVSQF